MAVSSALYVLIVLGLFVSSISTEQPQSSEESKEDHDHDHHHGSMNHSRANNTKIHRRTRNRWEAYVYGTLCVTVVSLLSLAGVIAIPFIKRKIMYDGFMLTFMALAVGTMTSDALLHLIPETLGLDEHSHEEEGNEDSHEEEHEHEHKNPYLGKMVALLATLYGLYLLELILHIAAKLVKRTRPTVHHSNGTIVESGDIEKSPTPEKAPNHSKWTTTIGHSHGHSHGHTSTADASSGRTICGLKSVAFVVVLSDAMHNFTDGLAIGAAFSRSSAAGLGVTIAVVCHEIPHEIGNFAILLNTGMSFKKALLLNFLSAVTCAVGLYPGIVAGEQDALAKWIFAAVAAGFLYVAMVHMLRELQQYGSLPWYLSFILQNVGLLAGFTVIYILAIYEHDLNGIA